MDQNTAQTTPVSDDDSATIIPAPVEPVADDPYMQASLPAAAPISDVTSPEEPILEPSASDMTTANSQAPQEQTQPTPAMTEPPAHDAVTAEEREKLYHDLAETMLQGLESGSMEVEASEDSSEYILQHLDKLQTKTELMAFLEEVGNRWPVYKTMTTKEVTEEQDQNKIEDIQGQLHQYIKE